jgi:hypothetical protein
MEFEVCDTPDATLSRYDVYAYEINQNLVGDWSRGTLSNNYAAPPPMTTPAAKSEVPVQVSEPPSQEALALYGRH